MNGCPSVSSASWRTTPNDEIMAGTFNLHKGDRLYGRYWGCDEEVDLLHFETCYYAMIDWATEHGVNVIEPGQGGEHKYARGFEPEIMYSAHWIRDDRLAVLLKDFLEREREVVRREVERMEESSILNAKKAHEASGQT